MLKERKHWEKVNERKNKDYQAVIKIDIYGVTASSDGLLDSCNLLIIGIIYTLWHQIKFIAGFTFISYYKKFSQGKTQIII